MSEVATEGRTCLEYDSGSGLGCLGPCFPSSLGTEPGFEAS